MYRYILMLADQSDALWTGNDYAAALGALRTVAAGCQAYVYDHLSWTIVARNY